MSENINFDYNKLTPFKWFIIENFPFLEDSIDGLTNYQLFCKLGEEINKIIDSQNIVGEQAELLTTEFNNLYNYVDNYFKNLDIQEEINTKIDEMAEDGYFQTLVENYATPILNDLTERVNDLADEVETATDDLGTKIEELRKEKYNRYSEYDIPFSNSFFKNVQVYRSNEKANINVGCNIDDLKIESSATYYVSKSGSNSNNGTSEETAWASIGYAVRNAPTNSTIIILDGIYYRSDIPDSTQPIVRNFNIIGKNKALIVSGDNLTYTQDSTYTNTYKTTRTNIFGKNVIDIRNWKQGIFARLKQTSSASECNETLNSYYYDSSNLYVNIGEPVTSEKIVASLLASSPCFNITSGADVYIENLNFIGGHLGCIVADLSTVKMYKCTCLYGGRESGNNVINISGSNSILIDTKANYGGKDGINYYVSNNIASNGIEINCEASNNGLDASDNTNNGSTAHGGSKVIRVNGNYFNNKGCNVADVHSGTESYNFNCNAFDSISSDNSYSQDFSPQQEGATMHLINCYAKGSSYSNIYVPTGATVYIDNTEYNNTTGSGTIIEE